MKNIAVQYYSEQMENNPSSRILQKEAVGKWQKQAIPSYGMNDYLSEIVAKLQDEFAEGITGLATDVSESSFALYLCSTADISEERLGQLSNGSTASVQEMIAITSSIEFLASQDADTEASNMAEKACAIRSAWFKQMSASVKKSLNAVDSLAEMVEMENEAEFLQTYHIFMDASALCTPEMPVFLDKLLPRLQAQNRTLKITVPLTVVNRMAELTKNPEMAELSGATAGIEQLARIQNAGLLSVRGDAGDASVMSSFLSAFSRFKPKYNLVLFTQDETLANAVQLLNCSGVEGSDILAAKLQEGGVAEPWFDVAVGQDDVEAAEPDNTASLDSSVQALLDAIQPIPVDSPLDEDSNAEETVEADDADVEVESEKDEDTAEQEAPVDDDADAIPGLNIDNAAAVASDDQAETPAGADTEFEENKDTAEQEASNDDRTEPIPVSSINDASSVASDDHPEIPDAYKQKIDSLQQLLESAMGTPNLGLAADNATEEVSTNEWGTLE